jgi:membrane fusion protein (multidrug efflux system)
MTYRYFVFCLIIVPAIFSCNRKTDKTKERPAVTVDIMIAQKLSFPASIEVNGVALSGEMIQLYPEVSGRLVFLDLPDGATVSKGAVLARINDAELQAELEQQKVQLELAVKTENRLQKLLSVNGVNQAEYDAALNQVHTINANINVLKAQLDKTIVRAAFSGKLGLRMVSPGAYVTPQTLLGTLQETTKIKIDFSVPESYANQVEVGNTVYITTNSSGEQQTAVISAIEPQISLDTRNIKVRAWLENSNINPGAFVKVNLNRNVEGIVVPTNCIIPDASSNQVVLVKNKKAVFANVETGIRNADLIELASGVNVGDTVVISGVLFVRPNGAVKIREISKPVTGDIQGSKQSVK